MVGTPARIPVQSANRPTCKLCENKNEAKKNFSPPFWSRPEVSTLRSCSGVEPGSRESPGIERA